MTNYLPTEIDVGEPPDFLGFDHGELPDLSDVVLSKPLTLGDPPNTYAPPGYLVDVTHEVLLAATFNPSLIELDWGTFSSYSAYNSVLEDGPSLDSQPAADGGLERHTAPQPWQRKR